MTTEWWACVSCITGLDDITCNQSQLFKKTQLGQGSALSFSPCEHRVLFLEHSPRVSQTFSDQGPLEKSTITTNNFTCLHTTVFTAHVIKSKSPNTTNYLTCTVSTTQDLGPVSSNHIFLADSAHDLFRTATTAAALVHASISLSFTIVDTVCPLFDIYFT